MPVARLRAEGLVTEVRHARAGDDALRGRGAAARRRPAARARRRRRAVHTTEGWPAALSLAARTLRDQPGPGPGRRALRRRRPVDGGVPARRGPRRALRGRAHVRPPQRDPRRAQRTGLRQRARAARLGRRARRAGAVRLPARGARPHGRALPPPPPAERPAARGAAPRRAGARGRAAPPRQRLARARRATATAASGTRWRRTSSGAPATWCGPVCRSSIEQGSSADRRAPAQPVHHAQVAAHPRLALAAAATSLAHGHGDHAEHWLDARRRRARSARSRAASRPCAPRSGATASSAWPRTPRTASALLEPESPCQALCGLLGGVADHLRGDAGRPRAPARRGGAPRRRARPRTCRRCASPSSR